MPRGGVSVANMRDTAAALALEEPVPWGPRSEAGKAARNKRSNVKKQARRKARAGSSGGRGGPGGS